MEHPLALGLKHRQSQFDVLLPVPVQVAFGRLLAFVTDEAVAPDPFDHPRAQVPFGDQSLELLGPGVGDLADHVAVLLADLFGVVALDLQLADHPGQRRSLEQQHDRGADVGDQHQFGSIGSVHRQGLGRGDGHRAAHARPGEHRSGPPAQ